MPKIKVNDVELNYEEHGSGAETVVFGHGFGSSARKWQNLFELLPANYHCYALDLRGFGKSAEITENINPAQMADDIYQFSKEMGLGSNQEFATLCNERLPNTKWNKKVAEQLEQKGIQIGF